MNGTATYRTFQDEEEAFTDELHNLRAEDETAENGDHYTVDNAVEKIGFGRFQLILLVVCGSLMMADAMEMLLLSVLSPVLRCEWNLPHWEVALITTVVFTGMFVAAPVWGSLCDKFGRRPVSSATIFVLVSDYAPAPSIEIIIMVAAWVSYFGVLTSFSPTYPWILILRGLVGAGMAGGSFGYTLLSEYLPSKNRARFLIVYQLYWATGTAVEVLLASVVVPRLGWRWLVFFSSLPVIFSVLFMYLYIPESARFLVAAGRREEATLVLQRFAERNKSTLPKGVLVKEEMTSRGTISDLFVPEYRRTTLSLLWTWFGGALIYYGMILASSEIEKFQTACDSRFSDNTTSHVTGEYVCSLDCKELSTDDYYTMLVSSLGEFIVLPLNFVFLDLLGRRWTLCLNCMGAGLMFLMLQICTSRQVLSIIALAVRAFSAGILQANFLYTTEVYPTTMRSVGLGVCSSMARLGAMITPFVAQVLLDQSAQATVYVYGLVGLFCGVVAYLLPVETKGREMPQTMTVR